MDDSIRELIFQAIDQTISERDFDRLQDAIERDPNVREEYLRAVSLCETLGDCVSESPSPVAEDVDRSRHDTNSESRSKWRPEIVITAVAGLLLVIGVSFWFGRENSPAQDGQIAEGDQPGGTQPSDIIDESRIAGHATLRRAVDLEWVEDAVPRREGDVLPNGSLAFDEGVAEIDFFCGATLIVEGPARLDIESDWSVIVSEGRLRANVPPAARGFVVKAAGSEIVDLGTEFALEVGAESARVEVIDGEIELRGGKHDGQHLVTGQSQSLKGTHEQTSLSDKTTTVSDLRRRQDAARQKRFAKWKADSSQLSTDKRLLAWYPIATSQSASQIDRVVGNSSDRGTAFDGMLVGPVERTTGRFGEQSAGLEFDRPGSRVRTRIDGEFAALTFVCWVRIDSLEHLYNALFMADSYQTGEPHWQIREDGCLMFSVMVDDTQKSRHFSKYENRMVTRAGLARVYYTKPFWDISKSGQWFHLAAVYDPTSRRVDQYVNGQRIASQDIIDKYYISTLRIGAAEIGNWGQPFRKTPSFAVRNLNGTIDELAIFDAALNAEEINNLYQQGKPLGY